jgi:hypothetical protein
VGIVTVSRRGIYGVKSYGRVRVGTAGTDWEMTMSMVILPEQLKLMRKSEERQRYLPVKDLCNRNEIEDMRYRARVSLDYIDELIRQLAEMTQDRDEFRELFHEAIGE